LAAIYMCWAVPVEPGLGFGGSINNK